MHEIDFCHCSIIRFRFEVKKWNAVALWAWDIVVDNCAICRLVFKYKVYSIKLINSIKYKVSWLLSERLSSYSGYLKRKSGSPLYRRSAYRNHGPCGASDLPRLLV